MQPDRQKPESSSRLRAVRASARLSGQAGAGPHPRDPASTALIVGVAILGAGALIALGLVISARSSPPASAPPPSPPTVANQPKPRPKSVQRQEPHIPAPQEDSAPKLSASEIEALVSEGTRLVDGGDVTQGIAVLTRVIAMDPQNADAHSIRSCARLRLGDFQGGLADADRAVEISPRYWGAWVNRGHAFSAMGQLDEAVESFSRAIEIEPRLTGPYFNRTLLLRQLKRWHAAILDYSKILEVDPKSSIALYWRGYCFAMLEKLTEAAADFEAAIALAPQGDPDRDVAIRNLEAVRRALRARNTGDSSSAPMIEEPEDPDTQSDGAARTTPESPVAKAGPPPAKGEPSPPAKPAAKQPDPAGPTPSPQPPEPADPTGPEWPAQPTKSDFTRLFQAWKKAPLESEYFQRLQVGFLRTPVDQKTLDSLAGMLGDKAKGESAAQVLQVQVLTSQTGLTTPSEFAKKWKAVRTEFKDQTRRAPIARDLLAGAAQATTTWQLQGGNLRLGAGYSVDRLPIEAETRPFTILVRAWVPTNSTRTRIGLGSSQGAWEVEHKNGEWTTKSGSQVSFVAPAVVGWNELSFDVGLERAGNVRGARTLTITVNGKNLLDRGGLNGDLTGFRIEPGEPGAVFAGADFRVR